MATNGKKWQKIAKIAKNCQKSTKIDKNQQKSTIVAKIDKKGQKLTKYAKNWLLLHSQHYENDRQLTKQKTN